MCVVILDHLPYRCSKTFSSATVLEEPLAPLTIDRSLRGDSQIRGLLHVSVRNNDLFHARDVLYAETLPPLVTLYLHTLEVYINGRRSGTFLSS
jgi:hypothetical protein